MEHRNKEKNGNQLLAVIEALLNEALGVDVTGRPLGTLALREVLELYGGMDMYIPKGTELYMLWRNEQIRVEFNGDNYTELAAKWSLDVRHIRRIVAEAL